MTCSCGPETSARLIGDEAYCNECDEQVRPSVTPPSARVASSDVTLATLALSPRTIVDFTASEEAAIQRAVTPNAHLPNAPRKDEVRLDAQRAVAIAHGRGAGMSLLALFALVLEEGIPSRAERERIVAERLQEDGAVNEDPPNRLGDTIPD